MQTDTHMTETKVPERTCVGCRERDDRDALVRFVLGPDGRLVADATRRLPGRGVSAHPRRSCIEAATRRGGFARAFGAPVEADADVLAGQLVAQLERRIDGLLVAAKRAGHLALGTEAVRGEMRGDGRLLLVVAADAAGRREEIERAAERLGDDCIVYGDKSSLGRLFGRDEVGVLAIDDRGIAKEIARAAACISGLRLRDTAEE
jgi:hypothetical protein